MVIVYMETIAMATIDPAAPHTPEGRSSRGWPDQLPCRIRRGPDDGVGGEARWTSQCSSWWTTRKECWRPSRAIFVDAAGDGASCRLGHVAAARGGGDPDRWVQMGSAIPPAPRCPVARCDPLWAVPGGLRGGSPAARGDRPGWHPPPGDGLLHRAGAGRPLARRGRRGAWVPDPAEGRRCGLRRRHRWCWSGRPYVGCLRGLRGAADAAAGAAGSRRPGGTSSLIRNYLGFPRGLSGDDLTNRALEQAWLFGAEVVLAQSATGLRICGSDRVVRVSDGSELVARAVVVATGVSWRRLGVPRLEALHGAGVFYGASGTEARAMEGQNVCVVGAGN